jgi:hypothetical protein
MESLDNYFIGVKSLDSSTKIITEKFNDSISGYGKLYTNLYSYNGSIKDGKLNGDGILFYINDSKYKSYEGTFINNEFNGLGKLKYLDGNIFIGNFLDNKKHGSGLLYNSNGNILIDEIWNNDIIIGKKLYSETYHNTTKLKTSGTYHDSIKIGTWINYRENEIIESIYYYSININKEILESILNINESGYIIQQKISNSEDIDLINDQYTYIKEKININKINKINNYKIYSIPINKNNNEIYLYFENNERKYIRKFYNNKEYDIIIYKNNNTILYKYDTDMKKLNTYIYNNKKELYYCGEVNYNNEQHGYGYLYEDNKLKISGNFYKGIIIKGILLNGDKIIYEGTFKNKIPHGEGIIYDDNGNKSYEGMIAYNNRHGDGISYWENGNTNWHGKWNNNKKHGKGKLYDDNGNLICICIHEFDQLIKIY